MEPTTNSRTATRWKVFTLAAVVTLLALLPWWRNHGFLRDFYDYGLVIAGTARIAGGERPYADFTTPIQCGTFWFNALAETFAGGTFQAMTFGGAVLIIVSFPVLAWLLVRRLPWWAAIAAAGAVVVGSASQHTIVWHNSVGVVCLAIVSWGTAVAPTWRRAQWREHTLVAAALLLGGVNKLNFHLVALAVSIAWLLRAGLLARATRRECLATLAAIVASGVFAPLAAELSWTGATVAQWWYNVVALPAASRVSYVRELFHSSFYLAPPHDYYGALLVPAVGLLAGAFVASTGAVAIVTTRRWDRALATLATCASLAAALALLATNHEIGYVGLAAGMVLALALLLGFASAPLSGATVGGLTAVCVVFGCIFGWSAWQGQRSQFGHSDSARCLYRDPSAETSQLAYLRGTRIPPEFCTSIEDLASSLPSVDTSGLRPVFYGPGLEWFERICPAVKNRGLPLWLHDGTSYGPRERNQLAERAAAAGRFQQILVPNAWDRWPRTTQIALELGYVPAQHGPILRVYEARPPGGRFADPIAIINDLGGNLHPTFLSYDPGVIPRTTADGRLFLGRSRGARSFRFTAPSNRLAGTAVLQRLPGTKSGALHAEFVVFRKTDGDSDEAWRRALELPVGIDEISADYVIDGCQNGLRFEIVIPPECDDAVCAGWLGPRILHAQPDTSPPPTLFAATLPDHLAAPDEVAPALPSGWRPREVVTRGGKTDGDHFTLSPGGELWLRADKPLAELLIRARVATDQPTNRMPIVRLIWYKGGRTEILHQTNIRPSDRQLELRAWSAEPEGWVGIVIDPTPNTPPALVYLDSARLAE